MLKAEPPRSVLVVTPNRDDADRIRQFLAGSDWIVLHARAWREAASLLAENPVSVVITEDQLDDCSWRQLRERIGRLADGRPPCLVVTSAAADDQLWSEVLNLGGYNVLARPFDRAEVNWVLAHAYGEWSREETAFACDAAS